MLYFLFQHLEHYFRCFHIFQYITFRTILSFLTSFFLTLLIAPKIIKTLSKYQIGQYIRDLGPKTHVAKSGTPTMGGCFILISITLTTIIWGDITDKYLIVVLYAMLGFGFIGWCDDYKKLILKNGNGISAKYKYLFQTLIALSIVIYLYKTAVLPIQTQLFIPFFKDIAISLGFCYLILAYFVIVGSSNAVNLTDGLDGLAIVPTIAIAAALGIFAYVTGNIVYTKYLSMPYIPKVGELSIFCGSLVGSGLGFLWFNAYPAQIFMGDVGSLGLGAALGTLAVIIRQEIIFFFMGGIFVLETMSVILQVISYKFRKKRIFKMAPIHHHFELKGWPETKVIVRFWIISIVLVICALATLKLR